MKATPHFITATNRQTKNTVETVKAPLVVDVTVFQKNQDGQIHTAYVKDGSVIRIEVRTANFGNESREYNSREYNLLNLNWYLTKWLDHSINQRMPEWKEQFDENPEYDDFESKGEKRLIIYQ